MDKQEETREGVALYIAKIIHGHSIDLDTLSGYDRATVMLYADEIIELVKREE